MKLLYDFFPVILFFVAYKLGGLYAATLTAMVASALQVGIYWLKFRKTETLHLITFALLLVFGSATLILKDPMFIKWKPSVVNWLFAAVFVGSQFVGKKSVVERMMGNAITLSAGRWRILNLSWAVFFTFLGFANLYVVYNFDENTWVNFKLFGMMGLTFLFIVLQMLFLARHMHPTDPNQKEGDA